MQEQPVDFPYRFRLSFVDDQVPVLAPVIAEEPAERDAHLAVCEPLPHAPGTVFGNAPALLLRQRGHDGDEQLALGIEGPDVLLLKITLAAVLLQLPYGGKAVDRVPCEPRHALGDDEVDAAGEGVLHHLVKAAAVPCGGCTDPLIRIQSDKLPVLPALYVIRIVIALCGVAGLLVFHVGGNAGVACHSPLLPAADGVRREAVPRSRYRCHVLCHFLTFPP